MTDSNRMKTLFQLFSVLCVSHFCVIQGWAGSADTDRLRRLTVELRDGSRVVGQSVENTVSVHSAAMGDLKLAWAGIRSIEYAASTDAARLTATNGDGFAVQLNMDTLRLETDFGKTELPVKLIRSIKVTPEPKRKIASATPAVNATGFRLTIELRDGSHLVGKGLDDALNFHSSTMGDLKLGWAGIRSVIYASEQSPAARLTTTNGDAYEVEFVTPAVRVETSFGKNELPVKAIRSLKVSALGGRRQLPSGLVALWSGEGNADDSVTGNIGTLNGGATFSEGEVGQAFKFHNIGDSVTAPATGLLVGAEDRTIACWIYVESFIPGAEATIAVYGDFSAANQAYLIYFDNQPDHRLRFSSWGNALVGPSLDADRWHHVAVTSTGTGSTTLYADGIRVASGSFNLNTPPDSIFRIGQIAEPDCIRQFIGRIDEVAVFNRALSAEEIRKEYEAGNKN